MIVILTSESPFLLDRELDRIKTKLSSREGETFEFEFLEGKESTASAILQAGGTGSLFATKRLLVVRRAEEIKKDELEALAKHFAQGTDPNNYLFLASKIDKRIGAWKELIAASDFRELKNPKSYEMPAWIQGEARRLGKTLRQEQAELLLDLVGEDLGLLSMTLEKLILASPESPVIDLKQTEGLVADVSTQTIFELTAAMGRKDMTHCFRILKKNFSTRDKLPLLVSMIYRHFRILLNFHEAGPREGEVAKLFKIPPFFMKDYQSQRRSFSKARCLKMIEDLYKMDRSFKTSAIPAETLIQSFLRESLI